MNRPATPNERRPPALSNAILEIAGAHQASYNAFLTAAVEAHPDTLRISARDIAAAPFSTEPNADRGTFAAIADDGTWLGVVTIEREGEREKRRHVAWVLRMVVVARFAGHGIGRALLRTAVARARTMPGVAKVNLTVAAHNARAVHLYESEGFRVFSREVDAFRDIEPRTELTMSLALASL
jgi:GNAT superfamily N-acetyltransferase